MLVTSKKGLVTPYMLVSISSLESKLDSAREIAHEVLLGTLFEDTAAIGRILRQLTTVCKEEMAASGHALALARSAAYVSREAAVSEYVDGLENYLFIRELDKNFASESNSVCEKLKALAKKIFTRSRITVCHTGKRCDNYAGELVSRFPLGAPVATECKIEPLGERREGIVIPAQIAFAAQTGNLFDLCEGMHGSMNVVRSLLSYGYLWNAIRVQGGAYGAGFVRRANGVAGFYTYRDPDPSRSINCFAASAEYLRGIAESKENITGFIIGAIGDSDPLITPKVASAIVLTSYLRGESYEEKVRLRRQMLDSSEEDLLRAADVVEKISRGGVTVVGGKDKLLSCGEKIEKFIEI
jgi:Zn-dependent M16 (insulinase) family peptidase